MTRRMLRLLAALVFGFAALALPITAAHAISPAKPAAVAGCSGSGCGEISPACTSGVCPVIHITPSDDVADDQWVTINLSGFTPGDNVTAYFCSDSKPLASASPACILSGTASILYPAQTVPIDSDGTGQAAVNVEQDAPGGGDQPLVGRVPGVTGDVDFYCDDDMAHRCSVDVVDSSLTSSGSSTPTTANTAVVPLNFLPVSTGCPKANLVTTSSDYSVQALLPQLAAETCSGTSPSLALDTANDLSQAASGLASGADSVLFTTDPQAADVKKLLAKSGNSYVDIPLLASADVLALSASKQQQSGAQVIYSDNSYSLTPNQAAGMLTYNYSGPSGADQVNCPSGSGQCSGITLLNEADGYVSAEAYGAFDPSQHTGVTDELLSWICHSPTLPYTADGSQISDSNAASTTLTTSTYSDNWPIKSCTASDQLPSLPSPSATDFALLSDPSQQAKYLRAFAPPPSAESEPVAGLAPMDWSQADFYGFSSVALQNAAGEFVTPSATSIDKALAAATVKDGVVTPTYAKAVSGAYPMSDVIYAVVRTGAGAAVATADAGVKQLLTEYLAHSTTASLPSGYVPLPSSLAAIATHDLATAIPSVTSPGKTKSGGKTKTGGKTSKGHGAGNSTTGNDSGGTTNPSGSTTVVPPGTTTTTTTPPDPGVSPVVAPLGTGTTVSSTGTVQLSASAARYGVPVLLALFIVAGLGSAGLRAWRRWVAA